VTIAAELRGIGLDVAQRSAGEPVTAATDILLADTLGEMGLFYRLSPIVWVGKSLVGAGGQNPLEPARLGASVLFGPKMDNFAEIAEQMVEAGAAETVPEEGALARAIARRLIDPGLVEQSGAKARNFATDAAGVLDAVLAELDPWLDGKRATP
jgi:3-deoxy-D-manno-octulosonic-acid transferase